MDVDFINAYITKQKAVIDDFQTRYLILETKHDLLAKELDRVKQELYELESQKVKKESK